MAKTTSSQQNYMPQLDALRAFAVLGVMVTHNWHPKRLPWLFGDLDPAGLGVRLFFVLSGFLITGILLKCRHEAEETGLTSKFFMRQFYIRRFLRIFPIYYLVVFIALLVDLPPAREIWGWLITIQISYGLYVYHNFMPLILVPILAWFGYDLHIPGLLNFLLSTLLTIVIAAASWHWIEYPINGLKERFRYSAKVQPVPTISERATESLN